jgi:hypothetical protein
MRWTALFLLAACGGGGHQITIGPPPPARTTGTLAGPLCQYDHCTCADAQHDPGVAEGNRKRFEIKLLSAQQLWATLPGDTVLYKTREAPAACFYVDLPPGQHPIRLRASDPNGVSAELQVHEIGAKAKTLYDTFTFECGNPGVCSFEELDALKAKYGTVKRGLHDPCGSTRIQNIGWDHGKAPDGTHPSELVVEATLDVYKFVPWKPHGDPSCGEGGGRKAPGEGGGEEGEPAAPPDGTPPAP